MSVRSALIVLLLVSSAHSQQPAPSPRAIGAAEPTRLRVPPPPRELRLDRLGYPFPPGAVARLGIPPPLTGTERSLAWTADGKRIVAVESTRVTVLDAATGRVVETLGLGESGRNLHALLPQDGRLLVRQYGRRGAVFDAESASDLFTFRLPATFGETDHRVLSLSASADGRFLAGVSAPADGPGVGWRYDVAADRFSRLILDRADLQSLRLSPDGRRVYATGGTRQPELTARHVGIGRELWTVPLKAVGTLRAVSADGRRLAVADAGGVTVFDAADGRAVLAAPLITATPPSRWGIELDPDGGRLAVADGTQVAVWDVGNGKAIHQFGHSARLVVFSPDGKSLLTASAWVQRWDLATGRPAYQMPILDKPVGPSLLRWSGDGKRLLTVWPGHRRGETEWRASPLAVWDVERPEPVWQESAEDAVMQAALDRTGSTVRVFTGDFKLRIWSRGAPAKVLPVEDSPAGPAQPFFAFLPDGRLAVQSHSVFQADLRIYGLKVREDFVPYRWPPGTIGPRTLGYGVGTMIVRPTGLRIDLRTGRPAPPLIGWATLRDFLDGPIDAPAAFVAARATSEAGTLAHVWEASTGQPLADLPQFLSDCKRATLSADGRFVVSAHERRIVFADLASSKPVTQELQEFGASAVAFSPDARRLAIGQPDGTVLLWDVPRVPLEWGKSDPDRLWADLAADDATRAWRTIWLLLDHPERALELLRDRLRPVPSGKDIPDLIARLDHPEFGVREKAMRALASRGGSVEMDLTAALGKATSAEQRARLERLIQKLDPAIPPAGDVVRGLRVVWVLERLGTDEAKRLLAVIAGGATGSRVTAEAKAALERVRENE